MTVQNQLPRIRSIIRFTLPKFFDPETYIWNRFSSADAILVDIRKRDDISNGEWRRDRLYEALDKAPYKPRIYVEVTSRRKHPDVWLRDIATCRHPQLHGFLMNLKDGDVLRDVEKIVQRGKLVEDRSRALTKGVSPAFKDASVLVDIEKKSIPYVIFKYHNFGARREGGWNHLNDLANKANAANVMALGWRSRPIRRYRELEREMITLKELGFAGVVLHDSDQIELANKIFS
ncbi:hypothetical protein Y032_0042g668 [Ancylostoma ceylanicum]|uniref:GP-PDE domain-containing protein n=1 Tax=Ancylostoma ceylanicum TaxID=53326 RepID=A0A016UHH2_9BILA|nr:hypothetical protein Y032_0042g668 [Ancylostoma ceylanicum]